VKITFLVFALTLLFLFLNFLLFLFTTFQAEQINIWKFFGKGFFHVLIISVIFVRCSYLYVTNKLFYGLFENNETAVFNALSSFLKENEKAQKLSVQTEDNYFLKINSWVERLPFFLRKIVEMILSLVPFYDIYQTSLTKNLTHEERVGWLIDEIKRDLKERFSVENLIIWMILIPLVNWMILIYYWLY